MQGVTVRQAHRDWSKKQLAKNVFVPIQSAPFEKVGLLNVDRVCVDEVRALPRAFFFRRVASGKKVLFLGTIVQAP